MLRDADLKSLYTSVVGRPLPDDPDAPDSPVQPASIDLVIGNIYVPDTRADDLGGVATPRDDYCLGAGETAVVTTQEQLTMPTDVGAIGFPPSSVSENGILTTNPGHIDPGYRGVLSLTVINMGRRSYDLKRGARILTL